MTNSNPRILYWRCPNCGQVHFGDSPPDMCAFCDDLTTWQPLPGADAATLSRDPEARSSDDAPNRQLPLFND